jgi:hypothetical protein
LLGGDAETLGQLMSASGVGALLGVVFVVPLAQARKRSGVVMVAGTFWLVFWLWVFSLSRSLPLSMLALVFGSMGAPTVMTMALGLVQVMSPANMRGRMLSLFSTISFGMQPVGALAVTFLAERLGVAVAIEISVTLLLLSALGMWFFRHGLRTWEVGANPAPTPAPAAVTPESRPSPEVAPQAQAGD